MKKTTAATVLLVLFIFLFQAVVHSETVTQKEARRAAIAWLNISPAFVLHEKKFRPDSEMKVIWDDSHSQILAFVLPLNPQGFIVVTPDKQLNPVIAYSAQSHFSMDEGYGNTLLHFLRNDISSRLTALEDAVMNMDKIEIQMSSWNMALKMVSESGQVLMKATVQSEDVNYGPYLSSTWDQTVDGGGQAAYSYYTPSNYYCGCVATAMGQIYNYYSWPVTGIGTSSYTWNNGNDPSQFLSVDHGATTYDWANMLDVYSDGGKTLAERQAVGQLLYQSGVAVEMDYSSGGSGANLTITDDAMEEHFRFAAEWMSNAGNFYETLYNNTTAGRLAVLGISRPDGGSRAGHAVVVDGVRHNTGDHDGYSRYYHLNMGWSSTGDAWYDLPNINTTANGGSRDYDAVEGAVLNVLPVPDMNDPGSSTTATSFTTSWDIPSNLNATFYELKKTYIPNVTLSFSDNVESGIGNWTVDGYWAQSTYYQNSGSYAFLGQVWQSTVWDYPGTMTFNQSVKIGASTTMSYYWTGYGAVGYQLRLEISTDGSSWSTLKSHDAGNIISWVQANVTPSDLSAYVGEIAQLRFVVDYLGGSISIGSTSGVYVDDVVINNGQFGTWETVSNTLTSTSQTIQSEGNGDYAFQVRANRDSQWWDWSDMESVTLHSALVQAKVFLEGAYNTAAEDPEMTTTLNTNGEIPLTSPYSEDVRSVASIPADITDWVLVQLRSTPTGSAVASRSAFLHKDGRIVNDDGSTGVIPLDTVAGDYYIVVRHRNHLAIMSETAVALSSGSSTLYDFTLAADQAKGDDLVYLETNAYGMYSGDCDSNGAIVFAAELSFVRSDNLKAGYYQSDLNLDGAVVFATELSLIRKNNLCGTHVQ